MSGKFHGTGKCTTRGHRVEFVSNNQIYLHLNFTTRISHFKAQYILSIVSFKCIIHSGYSTGITGVMCELEPSNNISTFC